MSTDRDARSSLPSPLEGEGASRSEAGEGQYHRRHDEWRTSLTPTLRLRAKSMRTNATEAEAVLWKLLRDRRFAGFKFRRQLPIGRFIVDFVCPSAMLIVELDGSQHAEDKRDLIRDTWLTSRGYQVLRVWNSDLFTNRTSVLDAIWHALHPAPHPPFGHPLPQGERGDAARSGPSLPSPLEGEGASRSEAGEGQFGRGEHP
ncbi:MAG TPA: endonuclease domain-containing protein [Devosia sp.]|uniref:endonuclease domain-containing protein n=1 Tax=Devosia sp. TaxID=1871048 RepID=UPI002DDCA2F5|nr:endonuclease domain-containing protein [Devosia sp.]HEV2514117.1 endonuclease domain-containing protein [Devosia sp.]